jgi:hypothetical protein
MKRPSSPPGTIRLLGDLKCRVRRLATQRQMELRLVSLLVGLFLLVQPPLAAQVREGRRVLILNDIGRSSRPGTPS